MRNLQKIPSTEIEKALIAEADNVDAWDEPITVGASSSPRPEWYGKQIAIGMSVSSCGTHIEAHEVYDFIASKVRNAKAYAFKPSGITSAAVDLYLVLGAVASITSIG